MGCEPHRGLAVHNNLVYIANIQFGAAVEDVSDPGSPVEVAAVQTPKGMTNIVLQGNYAYVTVRSQTRRESSFAACSIWANPTAPVQVGTLILHATPKRLRSGSYAVVPDMLEIDKPGNLQRCAWSIFRTPQSEPGRRIRYKQPCSKRHVYPGERQCPGLGELAQPAACHRSIRPSQPELTPAASRTLWRIRPGDLGSNCSAHAMTGWSLSTLRIHCSPGWRKPISPPV